MILLNPLAFACGEEELGLLLRLRVGAPSNWKCGQMLANSNSTLVPIFGCPSWVLLLPCVTSVYLVFI